MSASAPSAGGGAWRGRTALVTGASSGIGAAIAEALGRSGADLLLTGRDAARLQAAAARAGVGASRVGIAPAELSEDDQLLGLVARAAAAFERLDLLVHAAGALHYGAAASTSVAELDRQLRVNLRAPFLLTQRLLPLLRAASGRIVFVNSLAAHRPAPGLAAYSAAKAGLAALADTLRQELASDGIAVLSIFVGRTATPMQQQLRRLEGQPYEPAGLLQPEDVAGAVLDALALPARAEVTDLQLRPRR